MLEFHETADSRLENHEECEFPEDSDCESESEGNSNTVSGDNEVGCERDQKHLPAFRVGSLIA